MSIDFQIIDNAIARIVINRPQQHNALDVEHDRALADAWQRFNDDPQLKVAILSGQEAVRSAPAPTFATTCPTGVAARPARNPRRSSASAD